MTRILTICAFALAVVYLVVALRRGGLRGEQPRSRTKAHPRVPKGERWAQVYETDRPEEVQLLQARLEENDIPVLVYEQGKKDLSGRPLPGIGLLVPRPKLADAQAVVVRYLEQQK